MKKLLCSLMLLSASSMVSAGDCRPYFSSIYDMYDSPGSNPASFDHTPYHVKSVRLYHDGNTSFGMGEEYAPNLGYFNDRQTNAYLGFNIMRHDRGGEAYAVMGKFRDMFPSRNAAPLTTLTLFRSGEAQITLNEEDNRRFSLENLNCYGMDRHRFVFEGKVRVAPYTSSWIFTVNRQPSNR